MKNVDKNNSVEYHQLKVDILLLIPKENKKLRQIIVKHKYSVNELKELKEKLKTPHPTKF